MAESELRQVWTGLMPSFSEPATLLNISDPDDRAITMLLKTLYVVFKGVLEERHQLGCCGRRTSSARARTPDAAATGSRPASVEEIVPSSPGDLVPPSPADTTHFSQANRTVTAPAPSSPPTLLAPETIDIASQQRQGRTLPRPVAETVPLLAAPAVIWVPETLDTSPIRPGHRPCPVAETVPPPSTPPRPPRRPEPVSPVLPGRRARRAANRSGTACSPVPRAPPPGTPPPQQGTAAAASPTPSLSSPLLLPQHLPERPRQPAVPETILAESPKGRTERSTAGSARGASRLSRRKPSQGEGNPPSAPARGGLDAGASCRSPPAKKKKYVIIGPNDPVPPRKPHRTASPQKTAQQEPSAAAAPSTPVPHRSPSGETGSRPGATGSIRSSASAAAAVTPAKTTAQSIFELPVTSSVAQQRSSSDKGQTTSGVSVAGRRTPSKRKSTRNRTEQWDNSALSGVEGCASHGAESVLELDVLLEELDCEGAQDGVQTLGQAQAGGQGQDTGGGLAECQGDAPLQEDHHAGGDAGPEQEPGDRPEQESQDETQMDSPVFGDRPAAGPSFRYDAGPVRRKADRQKLPGWSCNLCKEWYADRDMTDEELRTHMNRCSRHRQMEPPPPDTPPGFWDPVGFPSMNVTQYGTDGPRTRARRKL